MVVDGCYRAPDNGRHAIPKTMPWAWEKYGVRTEDGTTSVTSMVVAATVKYNYENSVFAIF